MLERQEAEKDILTFFMPNFGSNDVSSKTSYKQHRKFSLMVSSRLSSEHASERQMFTFIQNDSVVA